MWRHGALWRGASRGLWATALTQACPTTIAGDRRWLAARGLRHGEGQRRRPRREAADVGLARRQPCARLAEAQA
eukprot:140537-Prymnesium_polylepis.1